MTKQTKYDLPELLRHWQETSTEFATRFAGWRAAISELAIIASKVTSRFEGRKQLAQNCCFLLLSKAFNHFLATYILFERGLVIDASLSARNALETLWMLELFAKDRTHNHFEAWSNGKPYNPSYVRKRLKEIGTIDVEDVTIGVGPENAEERELVYGWLSRITHSNLESLHYTVRMKSPQISIEIGGSLTNKEALIGAVLLAVCQNFLGVSAVCCAVFDLPFLEQSKGDFAHTGKLITQAYKSGISPEGSLRKTRQ